MKLKFRRWQVIGALGAGAGALAAAGLPLRTDVTAYSFTSAKIKQPVKALVLSDLHNDYNGAQIEKLAELIRGMNADFILMPGDIAEEHFHQERSFELIEQLAGIPMYYCTGNHEEFRWDLSKLKQRFRDHGVEVLDEKTVCVNVRGTDFEIAGISCRLNEKDFTAEEVNALFHTDHYRILLSHKPNWVNLYRKIHCDLIVCGHAHGGQWHIPFWDIPLAAPSQGLFPKYVRGVHETGEARMVVSRGMVRHYHGIPRLFNNPEIVILNFEPEG